VNAVHVQRGFGIQFTRSWSHVAAPAFAAAILDADEEVIVTLSRLGTMRRPIPPERARRRVNAPDDGESEEAAPLRRAAEAPSVANSVWA